MTDILSSYRACDIGEYVSDDTVLEELERDAREVRKGLWADPHPMPPWEWRKRSR